jgi:hypothetical protein
MSLAVPLALLGLVTIPAIILLHLLRNRRELLAVSSLALWRDLQQKRQGARPRNIPLTLLLLLQLLVATALTLALAQPVSSFLRSKPQHTIFILDTTTSMLAEDAQAVAGSPGLAEDTLPAGLNRRFDMARQMIQNRLQNLQPRDSFVIIGLNRAPSLLLAGDGSQKSAAQMALDNLVPGGTGLDLGAALTLANGWLAEERPNQILVLTDGHFALNPDQLPTVFAPLEWQFLGAGPAAATSANFGNQALLNVSTRPWPDGRHRLFARVVNYSAAPVERTVRVLVDERPLESVVVNLAPQAETAQVWTLPAQAETARVELVEADILPLDNRADLLLARTSQYRVLLLTKPAPAGVEAVEPGRALRRALAAQPGLELTVDTLAAITERDLTDFDLVVLDGLPLALTVWPAVNLLVVNPPLGHPLLTARNYARSLRHDPAQDSALLAGVDLAGVYFNRAPQLEVPAWAELDAVALAAANPNQAVPLILHGQPGAGRVVVWGFDLDQSNLPARLALPLLTANTLATLLTSLPPPVVPLGEALHLAEATQVELPGGRRQTVADGSEFDRTRQIGLYRLYNDRGHLIGGFAVQAGSALESNLTTYFDPAGLAEVETGAAGAGPDVEVDEYWPWLAGAALAVLLLEGWLAWRK